MKRKDTARREWLRAMELFSTLPDRALDELAVAGRDVIHLPGETIVTEGGIGIGFHVIVEGTCEVSADGTAVADLGPGQFFGEIALLERVPRSATVTAGTQVRTFSIDGADFRQLVNEHPDIKQRIEAVAAERRR